MRVLTFFKIGILKLIQWINQLTKQVLRCIVLPSMILQTVYNLQIKIICNEIYKIIYSSHIYEQCKVSGAFNIASLDLNLLESNSQMEKLLL